jgi:hypothetical protein
MGQPPERDLVNGNIRAGPRFVVTGFLPGVNTTTLALGMRACCISRAVVCDVPNFRVMVEVPFVAIDNHS